MTTQPVLEEAGLAGDEKWVFVQPEVGFHAHYVAVDCGNQERETRSISNVAICREGVVHNVRQGLQGSLVQKVKTGPDDWQFVFQQIKDIDLEDPAAKEAGMTFMRIHKKSLDKKYLSKKILREFVMATDIVMGPVCVLLGRHRPVGEWWRTPPEEILQGDYLRWHGSDNFFLQHPALVSLVSGLYRQVALLCRAGRGGEIIETLDYREVEECLSSGDYKLALPIIEKTRHWIEVPLGQDGHAPNYPFPKGYWRRLKCLQRGLRRHGYEKLMGQNFIDGWALEAKGQAYNGMYALWGMNKKKATAAGRQLTDLGRFIRRKDSGDKSAPRIA